MSFHSLKKLTVTGTGAVNPGETYLAGYSIIASEASTIYIHDSTNGGNPIFQHTFAAAGVASNLFPIPIKFETGLYVEVSAGTPVVSVFIA